METKTFDIGLDRYQTWCQHCGASIKKDAKYCRFCQEEVTSDASISLNFSSPEAHFEECRHWLPNLDDLVERLPDSDYKLHLLQATKQPD